MPHWAQKFMAIGKMQWIFPPSVISHPVSLLPWTRLQQAHCSILMDSLSFCMSCSQATEQILHSYFFLYPCSRSQRESQRLKCAMNTKSQAQMDQVWTFRVTVVNNILYPNKWPDSRVISTLVSKNTVNVSFLFENPFLCVLLTCKS